MDDEETRKLRNYWIAGEGSLPLRDAKEILLSAMRAHAPLKAPELRGIRPIDRMREFISRRGWQEGVNWLERSGLLERFIGQIRREDKIRMVTWLREIVDASSTPHDLAEELERELGGIKIDATADRGVHVSGYLPMQETADRIREGVLKAFSVGMPSVAAALKAQAPVTLTALDHMTASLDQISSQLERIANALPATPEQESD